MRKFAIGLFAAFAVTAIPLFAFNRSAAGADDAKPKAVDLENIEQLKAAFNKDAGVPRLVLLLSPT